MVVTKGKTKTKLPPITELLEEALLKDIEASGLSFDEISLVQLCDKKELIYGSPSSDIRRAIQKYFQKLKTRTPKNYNRLLVKHSIVAGPYNFFRLKQAEREAEIKTPPTASKKSLPSIPDSIEETSIEEASATDDLSIVSIESESESESESDSLSKKDSCTDIAGQFENLAIRSPPVRARMMTPTKTPIRKIASSIGSSGFASPVAVFASPVPSSGAFGDTVASVASVSNNHTVNDHDAYSLLNFFEQLGTKEQPHIIVANPDYPERNGPVFKISRLEIVEHNDHEYQGFHIRCAVDLPDFLEWEAFIPDPRDFPSLLPLYGRIIMIRGPSMPFWLRDDSRYHSDKKKIDCIATKKAHEKETTARNKAGESRLYSYHLIVFKPGTVLDNSVFSSNNTLVINQLSLKMEDNHPENKFAKKVHGMTLWWRIAEAGGTKIRNANSTIDATLLLD
jgi:hypothetical protein